MKNNLTLFKAISSHRTQELISALTRETRATYPSQMFWSEQFWPEEMSAFLNNRMESDGTSLGFKKVKKQKTKFLQETAQN